MKSEIEVQKEVIERDFWDEIHYFVKDNSPNPFLWEGMQMYCTRILHPAKKKSDRKIGEEYWARFSRLNRNEWEYVVIRSRYNTKKNSTSERRARKMHRNLDKAFETRLGLEH